MWDTGEVEPLVIFIVSTPMMLVPHIRELATVFVTQEAVLVFIDESLKPRTYYGGLVVKLSYDSSV